MTDDLFIEEIGIDYNEDISDLLREEENSKQAASITVVEERLPLFKGTHNPNRDIFIIPTQQGHDKEDQWNGSIGDAVMSHMHNMRHREAEMQHYIHTPNGNIFRVEANVAPPDEDGSRRIGKEIMEVMVRDNRTTEEKEELIAYLKSEIDDNRKKREEKADALDHVVVSYEDWESFPQMTKDWDVPSTPKPLYIYAGNSRQMFYDEFPETHPDARTIQSFISTVNSVDWDYFSEKTAEYFKTWLDKQKWVVPSVPGHFADFCDVVSSDQTDQTPDDLMANCLRTIDSEWSAAQNKQIISRFYNSQPIQLMAKFYNENEVPHQKGELVWSKVGQLGRALFKLGNAMTSAHWSKYFQLKKKLAPRVFVGDMDLNRANIVEMTSFFQKNAKTDFKTAEKMAKNVFFARPFMGVEELVRKNLIQPEFLSGSKKSHPLIALIRTTARRAVDAGNPKILSRKANELVTYQKNNPDLITEEEWSTVWQTYRICKEQVKQKLGVAA